MRYRIVHNGVPVAEAEAAFNADPYEFSVNLMRAEWHELSAFAAIRPTIQSRELALGGNPPGGYAGREAPLRRAEALMTSLELHDLQGRVIPTQRVDLFLLDGGAKLLVLASLDEAAAGIPAKPIIPPREGRAAEQEPE